MDSVLTLNLNNFYRNNFQVFYDKSSTSYYMYKLMSIQRWAASYSYSRTMYNNNVCKPLKCYTPLCLLMFQMCLFGPHMFK